MRAEKMDARGKLLLLVAACFVNQYLPVPWLVLWVAVLAGLLSVPAVRRGGPAGMVRAGAHFILFWLAMTAGSDVLLGKALVPSVQAALPLGLRLFGFTLVGVLFLAVSDPMEMGRAVAWFLRPVLGDGAWRPGLGLALVTWFLPVTLRVSGDIGAGIRARGLRIPPHRRLFLTAGTALRILEDMAGELAVGIASRRLDDPRSWF